MDEYRPSRRRKLSPQEQKALERQRRKQRDIARKNARQDAKYREEVRKQARERGEDSHIVIEIPARPQTPKKRRKKTTPDIIKAETNKRVRDLNPTDYDDGYYVDEVEVRKAQAQKQRRKRMQNQPKPLSPKQRKFRRILTYSCIIASVIIIGVTLSLTVLFKTESIVVEGNEYYEDSTIIELADVTKGENIFVATMFGNTDAVEDKLPYVKEAKINFRIPDSLVINIVHEEPYYALKLDDGYYLVNKEGRILEKTDKRPKKLMMVTAPSRKDVEIGGYIVYKKNNVTMAIKEILESFSKNGYSGITAIDAKRVSNISITYDNRILIKIGMPEDIDYKIRTAFTIINEKLDPNNTKTIKGVLNVSECNTTKKSYFNEGEIEDVEAQTETVVTQPTTESETVISTYVTTPITPTETIGYAEPATESYE